MKKAMYLTVVVIMSLAVLLAGCSNSEQEESDQESSSAVRMEDNSSEAENSETQMNVQVGGSEFTATLEENAAADGRNSVRCCPIRSIPFPVWVTAWVKEKR